MASPFLVPCLARLRGEFNTAFPLRAKSADGWIADNLHDSTSDHQPDGHGRVRAIDVTTDLGRAGITLWDVCERLRQHQASGTDVRLEYIIHLRKICSRSHDWVWRTYTGTADPHTGHAHLSARHDGTGYDDTRPWGVNEEDPVDWTDDVITNPAWRADAKTNPTVRANFAIYDAWNQAHAANVNSAKALAVVTQLAGKDFTDEPAIAAAVLAGLNPALIAAAIPQELAREVVDLLAARLQG